MKRYAKSLRETWNLVSRVGYSIAPEGRRTGRRGCWDRNLRDGGLVLLRTCLRIRESDLGKDGAWRKIVQLRMDGLTRSSDRC